MTMIIMHCVQRCVRACGDMSCMKQAEPLLISVTSLKTWQRTCSASNTKIRTPGNAIAIIDHCVGDCLFLCSVQGIELAANNLIAPKYVFHVKGYSCSYSSESDLHVAFQWHSCRKAFLLYCFSHTECSSVHVSFQNLKFNCCWYWDEQAWHSKAHSVLQLLATSFIGVNVKCC